ncbi:MAG TPA: PAC2 family protein [Chloroflexota bacterium]|jgi:predicted ATP-grasp superfamily ATP-dependent carboligase
MTNRLELELSDTPELRAPVLLAAFAGWGDGAVAGTGALQYLIRKHDAERLGGFDADEIFQYTTTRPVSLLGEDDARTLAWPSLELHACRLPGAPNDVLLLVGPEPDLRWRPCAAAIVDAAERLGASAVVVLGSYWDQVTHLGQPLLSGRAGDGAMRQALAALEVRESRYQGPTGFTSALLDACARRDVPNAGISARAPHYAQGIVHPQLSAALLRTVERLTDLRFDLGALEEAGREQARLLTERLQQEPKLWQYVQMLAAHQGQTPSDDVPQGPWQTLAGTAGAPNGAALTPDAPPPGTTGPLPTGEEMVNAVESFFRQRT